MGNPLAFLQTVIYTVSSSLLYPVMMFLVILPVWMVVFAGGFFAEWIGRMRLKKNVDITEYLNSIHKEKKIPDSLRLHLPVHVLNYIKKLIQFLQNKDIFLKEKIEALIQEKEMKLIKEIDKIRIIVRIGPSLGLMGTLIPLGTGLASLSKGDFTQMTSSLIVALTTTVVGLALGILAYFFATIKNHWVKEDIRNIELITEVMLKGAEE